MIKKDRDKALLDRSFFVLKGQVVKGEEEKEIKDSSAGICLLLVQTP